APVTRRPSIRADAEMVIMDRRTTYPPPIQTHPTTLSSIPVALPNYMSATARLSLWLQRSPGTTPPFAL
ncbi:MAG TPA: hypothetical protein VEJ87_14750, partial [Acidimicrobiales bacterium]|nr:hypothetical protein [Acidimicrobiales bacterium]